MYLFINRRQIMAQELSFAGVIFCFILYFFFCFKSDRIFVFFLFVSIFFLFVNGLTFNCYYNFFYAFIKKSHPSMLLLLIRVTFSFFLCAPNFYIVHYLFYFQARFPMHLFLLCQTFFSSFLSLFVLR